METGTQKEQSIGQGKSHTNQTLILLGLLLVVVILSIGGTLYVSGALSGDRHGDRSVVRKRVTLMDAQLLCEDNARKDLGRRIKNIAIDNHSSRYDDFDDRFKIFFTADLYEDESRKEFAKLFYVNCYTRSDREQVTTFDVSEDAVFKPKPIRERKGGAFGI